MSYLGPSLRRAARPRRATRRVLAALVLSLLANVALVTRLDLSWLSAAAASGPARAVSMAQLAARDWDANRAIASRPRAPQPAQPALPPPVVVVPPPDSHGQVVRANRPVDPPKAPPRDAKYLAEFDSAVEKETKARGAGDGNPRSAPQQASRPPAGLAGKPDARPDAAQAKAEQAEPERRRLALNFQPRGELGRTGPRAAPPEPRREPERAPAPGEVGPQGMPGADGSQRKLDLHPSAALYEAPAVAGTGGSPDYLPGVEEGEGTFLNTREWKYAGFFNRIMAEVRPNWVKELYGAVDARDPTRQRYLYKDRETVISVRLDGKGHLADIRVIQSSGVPFLDDAVVKAWKQSEPFVNVPRGLMNDRGEVAFNAGFIALGVNGSPVQLFLGPTGY